MIRMYRSFRRFFRNETGSASIEFCILFPGFMLAMLSSIEAGLMMTRNVMLERGVDIAVRELRLGQSTPDFDTLKATICDHALIIGDCNERIQMELQPVSLATFDVPASAPKCRDITSDIDPITDTTWIGGGNNDLMIVRVCALFDPFFSPSAWVMEMPADGNGDQHVQNSIQALRT